MAIIEFLVFTVCLLWLITIKEVRQPETFYQLESYQLAKYSRGTLGRICYEYANKMKHLFPEVKKERVMMTFLENYLFTHYRVIIFENDNLIIYTDSNQMGNQMIRTWYEYK